jgi:hypothetical protein
MIDPARFDVEKYLAALRAMLGRAPKRPPTTTPLRP